MPEIETLEDSVLEFQQATLERMQGVEGALERLNNRLDEMEGVEARPNASRGRQTEPEATPGDTPRASGARVLGPAARRSGSLGFRHSGEYFAAVHRAGLRGGEIDERLQAAAASTYGNEQSGSDGGFAVPPDYRATILEKAFGEASLIEMTMPIATASNSLTVPSDMTTPWSTSGVQAYWESEASAITQSKPELQNINLRLNKLAALVPASDELLEDAPAMASIIPGRAGAAIDFKLSDAIAYGSGAGQPLGFMNSNALVTQAAEGSQTADTIVAGNIAKMSARMPAASRRTAIWLIHPDAEHQLPQMTIGDQPIYLPPGGFRDSPFGTLLGRPVIPHQVTQTLGDLGDIMFVDPRQYVTATKAGGLRSQTSIHLWFDQDLTAFKFTIRVAGQPWWSETTTAKNGTFEMSPFVTLAART